MPDFLRVRLSVFVETVVWDSPLRQKSELKQEYLTQRLQSRPALFGIAMDVVFDECFRAEMFGDVPLATCLF